MPQCVLCCLALTQQSEAENAEDGGSHDLEHDEVLHRQSEESQQRAPCAPGEDEEDGEVLPAAGAHALGQVHERHDDEASHPHSCQTPHDGVPQQGRHQGRGNTWERKKKGVGHG